MSSPAGQPVRVLILEPDTVARALLRSTLELWGYVAEEAGSGDDAVRIARATRPRIVLVELVLPDDEDAFRIVRDIKASAEGRPITIYAVTSLLIAEERERAYLSGCDLVLMKLVRLLDLQAYLAAAARPAAHPGAKRKLTSGS